jgi:hypothetical protein
VGFGGDCSLALAIAINTQRSENATACLRTTAFRYATIINDLNNFDLTGESEPCPIHENYITELFTRQILLSLCSVS